MEQIELIFCGVRKLTNNSDVLKNELGKWQGIHPFLSNYDGMMTVQYFSNLLAENSEKIIAAQLESADKIVASVDYNANKISKNFSDSIDSLNSTFEWGFTEIIWKLGQQQKTLQKIIKTLQKPLETKSIELRNRGFDAYKNGWYDDAIKDLLHAKEDNRYDFTIHQTLGNIFLFHKYNPEKSIECYQNAAKYSEPYSKKFTSFAYLHLGLVYYFIHDYQNAYNSTLMARKHSPDYTICYYEHARYCAKLNKTEEAIESLKKIVYQEPFYCAKINSEPDFHPMISKLNTLFDNVYHHFELISQKRIKSAKELLDHAKTIGIASDQINSFSNALKNAEHSYSKSSILDFQYSIIESETAIINLLTLMQKYLGDQSEDKAKFLQELPESVKKKSVNEKETIVIITGGLIILWRIVHHVIDGIHLWGAAIGIIAGIIVGIIEGIIVAIILCGILYIVLSIIFYIGNRSSIKLDQDSTNQTLNKINQEFAQVTEQKNNFSYTFNRNKPEAKKLSWKNQLLKDAGFSVPDEDEEDYKASRFSAIKFDRDDDDDDDNDDDDDDN